MNQQDLIACSNTTAELQRANKFVWLVHPQIVRIRKIHYVERINENGLLFSYEQLTPWVSPRAANNRIIPANRNPIFSFTQRCSTPAICICVGSRWLARLLDYLVSDTPPNASFDRPQPTCKLVYAHSPILYWAELALQTSQLATTDEGYWMGLVESFWFHIT